MALVFFAAFPAAAAPLAYVTNEVAGTVTIFDTATNQEVQTVAMTPAVARPRGIQLTADGKRLYVALSDLAHLAKGPADAVVALAAQVVPRTSTSPASGRVASSPAGSGESRSRWSGR